MHPFVQVFKSPAFVWTCVSFLGALALLTGIRWWLRCRASIRALQNAKAALAAYRGQEVFAENFHEAAERIQKAFSGIPAFLRGWRAWSGTLFPFERADGVQVLAAEAPPQDLLNMRAWERSHAMHWYRVLPNYLIGLGLCFTFLGVVAVISGAADSLQTTNDAAKQTEALRDLLSAASFKFVTSLVGVFASVVYSFFFRWRLINVERELQIFVAETGLKVFLLNTSALLLQIREGNQRQAECLESMATNIGVAVGDQFTKASELMGTAISRLDETVRTMGAQMADKTDAVKNSVDRMSGGIVETTSKDLEKLVRAAVDSLNTALKDHLGNISESLERTAEKVDATRLAFADVVTHARDARDEYGTLADEVRTRTQEISELLLSGEADLQNRFDQAVGAAELIKERIADAAESMKGIESVGRGFADAASAVTDTASKWREMAQDVSELARTNGVSSEAMRTAMDALKGHWETQGSRIADIDTHLATAIGAVQKHFEGYASHLREYTAELDSQLGRAVGSFGATVEALGDAPDLFKDAGEQLQRAAERSVDALRPLDKLDRLAKAISEAADSINKANSDKLTPA